jgi:glycyl-tRNA synthetase beta chain
LIFFPTQNFNLFFWEELFLKKDFLVEVGVEELPVEYLKSALEQLKKLFLNLLISERFFTPQEKENIKVYATPRRLVVLIKNLPEKQKKEDIFIKGPPVKIAFTEEDKVSLAGQKFAERCEVKEEDLLVGPYEGEEKYYPLRKISLKKAKETNKYVFAVKEKEQKEAREILAKFLPELLMKIKFPKLMRWEGRSLKFARPIRWILALLNEEIVQFQVGSILSSRFSYGHRFLSPPEKISISSPQQYFSQLRKNFVIVDPTERKEIIKKLLVKEGKKIKANVLLNEDLLETVVFLTEYPSVLLGHFEEKYLSLPREVVITCLQEYQQFFPLTGPTGDLKPYFLSVVNNDEKYLEMIKDGNEKVLSARLADAEFYFKEDTKIPFFQRKAQLREIIWLENLGTMAEKVERIKKLAGYLAQTINPEDEKLSQQVRRLAEICKLDLTTQMLTEKEFSKLQGIIGREYAKFFGEEKELAEGIFEHYLPRFTGDKLPTYLSAALVGLADKAISLIGYFISDFIPRGGDDPYGCRRCIRGIIEIIIEKKIRFNLSHFFHQGINLYPLADKTKEEVRARLNEFLLERTTLFFLEKFSHQITRSLLAGQKEVTDLVVAWNKANFLSSVENEDYFKESVISFSRVFNILAGKRYKKFSPSLLQEKAEKELYRQFERIKEKLVLSIKAENYPQTLTLLLSLKKPIDDFFDQVLVMTEKEEIRENRLGLLDLLSQSFLKLADFSHFHFA